MKIRFHPHALARMLERGTTESEVIEVFERAERFPAKHGRESFRRNFSRNSFWRGKEYRSKQVTAIAVKESDGWLVITVVVKYF